MSEFAVATDFAAPAPASTSAESVAPARFAVSVKFAVSADFAAPAPASTSAEPVAPARFAVSVKFAVPGTTDAHNEPVRFAGPALASRFAGPALASRFAGPALASRFAGPALASRFEVIVEFSDSAAPRVLPKVDTRFEIVFFSTQTSGFIRVRN